MHWVHLSSLSQARAGFTNGIPNPLLPQNYVATVEVVKETAADFGVAFDGDFAHGFSFMKQDNSLLANMWSVFWPHSFSKKR